MVVPSLLVSASFTDSGAASNVEASFLAMLKNVDDSQKGKIVCSSDVVSREKCMTGVSTTILSSEF